MQTFERSRLIHEHLDYATALAAGVMSQFNLHGIVDFDDAVSDAALGLTTAADRFKPDNGPAFKTFSFRHIRGAVIDGIRSSRRTRQHHDLWKASTTEGHDRTASDPTRSPSARPGTPHYSEAFEDPAVASCHPFAAVDARIDLRRALDTLPDFERQIIVLFYFEEITDRRIAKRLGSTPTTVVRRRMAAQAALAATLNGHRTSHVSPEARR